MKPAAFEYHAPTTLDEALHLLATLDDAKVLAGGQSLMPLLSLRLARFDHLVDLRHVTELRGIERRARDASTDGLWVGAGTTQAVAARSADVASAAPLLSKALPLIGHFQIRNRGTVGGSLAHADPASELPAVALALDATFEIASVRGTRTVAAADFFTGTWATALDPDELLVGVRFPVWSGPCGFAIEEVARRHGDFAIAGACVGIEVAVESSNDSPVVRHCSIALFGLGPIPTRATAAERAILGVQASLIDPVAIGRLAVAGLTSIPSDVNGTSDYRRRVGAVVVARACTRALEEAQHG